jgi:hypothetical protein
MAKLNLVLICGIAFSMSVPGGQAIAAPNLPDFGAATFQPGQPVDNPYFPLTPGLKRIYAGERIDGNETILERFKLTTLGPGPTILGVQTTAQRDRAFENKVLVEETIDYFAQDTAGNVWYFGEDVTNFLFDDMGNPAGTNSDGAWRAGVNGALPGFIMPADLANGFNYYQEFAPNDGALDQATTISLEEKVSINLGRFFNVLKVFETSELHPDLRELKYYAPGLGLVLVEEGVNADLMNREFAIELTRIKNDHNEWEKDDKSMNHRDEDFRDDRELADEHGADDGDDTGLDHGQRNSRSGIYGAIKDDTLVTLFRAKGAADIEGRSLDMAPQTFAPTFDVRDTLLGPMLVRTIDSHLLVGHTIAQTSESGCVVHYLLLANATLTSGSQSRSAVPEPSARFLIVFALLAVCGSRSPCIRRKSTLRRRYLSGLE